MKQQHFDDIKKKLHALSDINKISSVKRFFKTKEGDYAENDIFIGISIPNIRIIAKEYCIKYQNELNFKHIISFLHSKIHEERILALLILVEKFQKSKNTQLHKEIIDFYINPANLEWINNWDLVDLSCYKILGEYLLNNQNEINILYNFAKSDILWVKRIAIVSSLALIKKNIFLHTIEISKILIKDKHDLIHKAVGWMLREIGKKNKEILINFLKHNYKEMSKTSISYASEKLNKDEIFQYKN